MLQIVSLAGGMGFVRNLLKRMLRIINKPVHKMTAALRIFVSAYRTGSGPGDVREHRLLVSPIYFTLLGRRFWLPVGPLHS
jgi:hypothetical protein